MGDKKVMVRQKLCARTEKVSVPLVQTVPLVGIIFCQQFPICWLIGIPLVGMCRHDGVVYMYTHVP